MNAIPVFLQEPSTYLIFQDIVNAIPKKTKFYIVGGAMRNIMFYYFFKKKLPQRDFDSIIIGNHKKFIDNLRKFGFVYGKIRRKNQITLERKKFPKAKELKDLVVLDIHWKKSGNILKELKQHSSFTINGFAIEVRDLFLKNWRQKIIAMTGAISDLKSKKLRVNSIDNKHNLFAAIRFMSLGFKKPSKNDIDWLLREFKNAPKRRTKTNLKKLFDYVVVKEKAKNLAEKLHLKEEIF
ncbi:MAG: hypothetical protein AABX28_00310 [Nanoarchaeota archaeon]